MADASFLKTFMATNVVNLFMYELVLKLLLIITRQVFSIGSNG